MASLKAPRSLDASKLLISKTSEPKALIDAAGLAFGECCTDHMLQVEWTAAAGWEAPRITPFQAIAMDPTAGALNYAFSCFEGMKAYKDAAGRVRLFRPGCNMKRFNASAARIALPTVDEGELVSLIAKFVALEERFIPAQKGYSMYLRPVMIGTSGGIGVNPPTSALLYVVASPVGSYYPRGLKAISLDSVSSSVATRAWPGGAGSYKVGGNYSPTVVPQIAAQSHGFQQVLWLFGSEDCVTEAGTMNFFAVFYDRDTAMFELVTPPLDGTILPGITRDCVLSMARERLQQHQWLISERRLPMEELAKASKAGLLIEAFGTGTAAVVCPIRYIRWRNVIVDCGLAPKKEAGSITTLMLAWIEARQYGEEKHEWSIPIDSDGTIISK